MTNLTNRELDILLCILEEKSNKEIANELGITKGTVKGHCYNIYKKTNTHNKLQVIEWYYDNINNLIKEYKL